MVSAQNTTWRTRMVAAVLAVVLPASLAVGVQQAAAAPATPTASAVPATAEMFSLAALSGSSFNPGYIISDYLFYQRDAMTAAEIQAFLDGKIGACGNTNCLNVYRMNTTARTANLQCSAYAAASAERASMIIYKIQQACGISAKVILATLQKEQSLVTSKAPSDGKIKIAMGYACPDTSVCDSKYFGLQNQLYSAAWQLKRYSVPNWVGNYHPGIEVIKYHPNAACGTLTVNIQNDATAALYNYTPYTPNAVALANLGKATPPCGSYGNRNFWAYFNTWFGDPLLGASQDSVNSRYAALGGGSGVLGAAGATTCKLKSAGCRQLFANGTIYWSPATGAREVLGAMDAAYLADNGANGPLGFPAGSEIIVTDNPNGSGTGQLFQGGMIYSSAAGYFPMYTSTRSEYQKQGSNAGPLGWPIEKRVCVGVECSQRMAGGLIFTSSARAAITLTGDYLAAFDASGGRTGTLKFPTSQLISVTGNPNGNGTGQTFSGGTLYSSAAGTFAVSGIMRTEYAKQGGNSKPIGWPTSAAACTGVVCEQSFQGALIVTSSATVAKTLTGSYKDAYVSSGGATGPLGVPTSDMVLVKTNPNGAGSGQTFTGGTIYSSAKGTFATWGAIRAEYWKQGGNSKALGWPTSVIGCVDAVCQQSFQGGVVVANGTVAYTVPKAYAPVYLGAGGSTGVLGSPKGAFVQVTTPNGAGSGQQFVGGTIYSSARGTFIVSGAVRTEYWAKGSNSGSYGWPTSAATCTNANVCTQTFQGGTITK